MRSVIAQLVLNALLVVRLPLALRVLRRIRSWLVRHGDPTVRYEVVSGRYLDLPLSHDLPIYRRYHPSYSANIGTIARVMLELDPSLAVIDIGANVGDTAAFLSSAGVFPILCVEGEPGFLTYLRRNVGGQPDVEIAPVFIAATDTRGTVEVDHGTARIILRTNGEPLPVMTISELVTAHPRFASARLVKIDTDGMDVAIILDNLEWLIDRMPVLFFEYDTRLASLGAEEATAFWAVLRDAGYRTALVYENTGVLTDVLDLAYESAGMAIDSKYRDAITARYADVCVFAESDSTLASAIFESDQHGTTWSSE